MRMFFTIAPWAVVARQVSLGQRQRMIILSCRLFAMETGEDIGTASHEALL
jgi:hypothetical protein